MGDSLDRLEKLTRSLVSFVDPPRKDRGVVEYDIDGVCVGFGLYAIPDIAVQRNVISKGSVFTTHIHEESMEYLIVYRGKLKIDIDGIEVGYLLPGSCQCVPMNTPHRVEALENTWLIGITIPAGGGYPNGD